MGSEQAAKRFSQATPSPSPKYINLETRSQQYDLHPNTSKTKTYLQATSSILSGITTEAFFPIASYDMKKAEKSLCTKLYA